MAALAVALPAAGPVATAQSYPVRSVRLIVGFSPSGGNDIVARLIADWLGERLGQSFLVENRPGGGGNIATEAVVNADADGHTLLLVSAANAINSALYDKSSFNFIRDINPVAGLMRVPHVLLVHPSLEVKTLAEFIAYARRNPGKLNMASGGTGSAAHLAGELLKTMTDVEMIHVPYRGASPAIMDLLGGRVQVVFGSAPSSAQYIRDGALRALAVTGAARLEALPEIPTVAEFLPGYEATQWYGIGAPRNTPAAVIDLLNREINAALADPGMKKRLTDLGGTALLGSSATFARMIVDETAKWEKVIQRAGPKP